MTAVIPIHPLDTPEAKCTRCRGAVCCTYLTQRIDTPRSMADFDLLRWQLSHRDTQAYKDVDGWFLLVNNPCRHLRADGRCGIYETRPQVCRDHSTKDCEVDGPAPPGDFELFFADDAALDDYCRRRFKHWDARHGRDLRPPRAA